VAGEQVPTLPATSQASHWPLQAVSQQTPSTQLALEHWLPPPQLVPLPSCATHTPPEHQLPAWQSPSLLQLPRHARGPQA
jgi:hypothetical protein